MPSLHACHLPQHAKDQGVPLRDAMGLHGQAAASRRGQENGAAAVKHRLGCFNPANRPKVEAGRAKGCAKGGAAAVQQQRGIHDHNNADKKQKGRAEGGKKGGPAAAKVRVENNNRENPEGAAGREKTRMDMQRRRQEAADLDPAALDAKVGYYTRSSCEAMAPR